ncbi:uncharacterized protein JCM6883_002414 [Sporobolomyces salmoneus]|uniref:uncharacterized protein n=1 Tax=Sporobolomyces salmoneus TaxID=183962 RepID=UPI003170DA8C
MTTSSPLTSSTTKPHLSSLSVGPTPRPPPSLPSASPSTTTRRITSWGSINSESGLSAFGERGMTPLPSPMDNREWGFLPHHHSSSSGAGVPGSWGKKSTNSHSRRWDGGDFAGESPSSVGAGGGKSWMSNFHQHQSSPSSSHHSPHLPTTTTTASSSSTTTPTAAAKERTEPTRSKTLSFFDSSSPVIAPSGSSSSLNTNNDPSFLLLSPPPNPPSRNNSLNSKKPTYQPNRPRSSSRLSISDLPDPLRSSTTSTTGSTSWLEDFSPSSGGGWKSQQDGGGGGGRRRVPSIGSWSNEVNKAVRLRTDTNGSSITSTSTNDGEDPTPVERRLFMDLDSSLGGAETARNSPDRPRLSQLDTTFNEPQRLGMMGRSRERSISNTSTGSIPPFKPLSSLPTAIDDPSSSASHSNARTARFLNHHDTPPSSSTKRESSPSYRDSPPPPIDLSQLPKRGFLAAPNTGKGGQATPRTPPSMEELQKIIGGTSINDPSTTTTKRAGGGIEKGDRIGDYDVVKLLGKGAFSRVALAQKRPEEKEVALKLMERKSCEGNERMRISVLREVEVLKNISHPSLVTLSSSFLTPLYTVLVLDYCPGGELFDFLAEFHSSLTEGLARRMFGELCDAVGWMHRVGLVHRDIKLENILLTTRLFPLPIAGSTNPLDHLPSRFLKLTDFGLSRFLNPSSPLLQTRCGSEAYAAPELLMGKLYDGTATDSWAVGVVLYAIATGGLPFVEEEEVSREKGEGLERRVSTRGGRKGYLLKIAKAEYGWPTGENEGSGWIDESLKGLVGKLLVRDPTKRWRIDGSQLWEHEWMTRSEGGVDRVEGVVRGNPSARGGDQVDFNDSKE